MSIIDDIRLDHEDLAKVLKKHLGIRKTVEELYPDSAHFIYELLQNAEDTGAKNVNFFLKEDSLVFAHDGRPFNERDIKGITDIGDGSKSDDNDSIGQFGIGFKAVFAYSETPRVWSPTFSFEIRELVLPFEIPAKNECLKRTCFEFPFNNPKKNAKDAFMEVKEGLEKLPVMTLLFLSSIETITWQIGKDKSNSISRINHGNNHIELLKFKNKVSINSKHFLRFTKPLNEHKKQYVSIAFNLEYLNKIDNFDITKKIFEQMKILPASQGRVSVYFPAEKEISGLRFHVHAPFVPELSRASIKDTPVNNPLYKELANLTIESLFKIKDMNLLTSEFLSVLPNDIDELSEKYKVIRTSIIDAMNNEELTPTFDGGHREAKYLVQAKNTLKKLLSWVDLNFLLTYSKKKIEWTVGSINNSLQDRFLSSLDIKKWDLESFIEVIETYEDYSYYDDVEEKNLYDVYIEWLNSKDSFWFQKLYVLFYEEDVEHLINNLSIVRKKEGGYARGADVYFSNNMDMEIKSFHIVDEKTYTSGNEKENEKAKLFLEQIGTKTINEIDRIKVMLDSKYSVYSKTNIYRDIDDFSYMIDFFETHPSEVDIFKKYKILKNIEENWLMPNEIFHDNALEGLDKYFSIINSTVSRREFLFEELKPRWRYWSEIDSYKKLIKNFENKSKISDEYFKLDIEPKRILKFLKALNVQADIEITSVPIIFNRKLDYLKTAPGTSFTEYGIDRDYTIIGLEEITSAQDEQLSLFVWKKMMTIKKSKYGKNYFEAKYRMNQSNEARYSESSLIYLLKTLSWVPQSNGKFVKPSEAFVEFLLDGFAYDSGIEWLQLVNFGEATKKKLEKEKEKEEFAKELGFETKEDLADAQEFMQLSKEERKALLDARRNDFEMPESSPGNPGFRSGRVGEQAEDAPEDTKTERKRKVSDHDSEVKKEADTYLRQQYTNIDGEMICQLCSKELPFKRTDGQYYFEKVKFLTNVRKLHYQNHLALCPNHAAMYKVINNSKDELLENFQTLDKNEVELEVVLGNKSMKIYFTETHVLDMKAVIKTDNNEDKK